MFKIIPTISAVLLLSLGSAYAQNNSDMNGSNPTITTTPTPITPTPYTTDSTLTGTTDTTTTPSNTTNGTYDLSTPGSSDINGTTPPTPVTTDVSTPTTTTGTTGVTTPSTGATTSGTTSTTTTTTSVTTLAPVSSFTCVGNAPSWNLSISKDLITYSSSKDPNVKLRSVIPLVPLGDNTGNLQVFSAKGANGKPVTILVKKNEAGCSYATPSQNFQYEAYVVFSNMVVTGCCNPL